MILYRKRWNGLLLLLNCGGSSVMRAVLPALVSSALAGLLELLSGHRSGNFPIIDHVMEHPYPYQVFAFTLGFVVVFRSNFAYQRYWQAVQHATTMTSKWGDVALQLNCFDTCLAHCSDNDHERRVFRMELVHLMSLLHGVALQALRWDSNVRNLVDFKPDAVGLSTTGFPSPITGKIMQHVGEPFEHQTARQGRRRPRCCASWHAARPCVLARDFADIQKYYALNPLHVIGGVSPEEENALRAVDLHTRVYLVMQWLTDCVVLQGKAKWFEVEGPIVSRIYQELSDGMLGFNQARKMSDVPFPFPYAQLVMILLLVYSLTVPIVMAAWLDSYWMVCGLTFVATWSYFAINEVNRDLEDPFLYDPNDLPLTAFQADLNLRLQSLDPACRSNRLTATKSRMLGAAVERTFGCSSGGVGGGSAESKANGRDPPPPTVQSVFSPLEVAVTDAPPPTPPTVGL